MTNPTGVDARRALAGRLRAIAATLLAEPPDRVDDPAQDAARLTRALAEDLVRRPDNDRVWLALAGVSAAFPTRDEVDDARRTIELSDPDHVALYLLDTGLSTVQASGAPLADVTVITGGVLVDVDFTARHDLHTGIQRVVRQTLPLWNVAHDVTPVAWTSVRGAMRGLDRIEAGRVISWSADQPTHGQQTPPDRVSTTDLSVVIPWRSVVVLPEVPELDITPRIAAIGACSNNALVAVGHDAIPLVSAETVAIEEPRKFMSFLSAVKFAKAIACVSESSAKEFRAYGSMLSSQGLPAPRTVAVRLPVEFAGTVPADAVAVPEDLAHRRTVVVVGSHDTRKNHLAVLHAAELLWQSGLAFGLRFIGSGGSNDQFLRRIRVLQERGRDVELLTGLSDAAMREAVAGARFTVFPSLHEGYGLPVAESLALGAPVITTEYGATAEIAAGGGSVVVDPRDDADLAAAMRKLLTDDDAVTHLRARIRERTERSWQDYADDLWGAIIEPVLADLARTGDHARC